MKSGQSMFQAVQPSPAWSCSSVPFTVIGSPIKVSPKSHLALAIETFTHPCETFRLPWSFSDHGAAWMYWPLQVSRWAYAMSTR
jgi:hypothetical protein